ncbi:MAG TPA: hypothetical protein PLF84_08125 [Bryobacteraceae bacterium]|nr:hypothetical protein [Bryobacterales bacterium]HRJ18995.1 hypothetical protein [Bryobacteraceae bacterium]
MLNWIQDVMTRKSKSSKLEQPLPVAAPKRGKSKSSARCVVCGSDVAQFSTEELCWVCRRLKISAWREADTQSAMQE